MDLRERGAVDGELGEEEGHTHRSQRGTLGVLFL